MLLTTSTVGTIATAHLTDNNLQHDILSSAYPTRAQFYGQRKAKKTQELPDTLLQQSEENQDETS